MQERAANLGYDWPSIDGVLDKVREEVGELVEAEDAAHRTEELGDLLFVLVNVGPQDRDRGRGRAARRQREVPRPVRGTWSSRPRRANVALRDLSFEELDALWDAAKAAERGEART